MTKDIHFGQDSFFKGIRAARWLTLTKPVKPMNDTCFGLCIVSPTKPVCDDNAVQGPTTSLTPTTHT